MSEQISKLEIRNFKKFNHLLVEDISTINLITGDNNVGKTTLLETLLVDDNDDKTIEFLHRTLCCKNFHIHPKRIHSKSPIFPDESYFKFLKNNPKDPIFFKWDDRLGQHSTSFQDCVLDELQESDFEKRKEDNYGIGNPKNWLKIYSDNNYKELQWMYLDDFRRDLKYGYWPLISFNAGYEDDINKYYDESIGEYEEKGDGREANQLELKFKTLDYEQKKNFISTLSMFISDIEDTTIRNYYGRDILSIKTKGLKDYQPITFWGEGFNKFVRYLLEIIQCRGSRIMIDEIDTGIHWSKQQNFWKYIIQSCQINNVQLFATTHSLDCIKAFVEAGIEIEFSDNIRLIELKQANVKGENKIYANTYKVDQIETAISSDVNIRGGKIYGNY